MISTVIINKNRLPYLALKTQSLLYQINRSNLDILVVDYSDSDEAVEYCRKQNIRCVRVKGDFNISEARNVGIRHSKFKWICISGNDTIIDKHYFAKLCGLIQAYKDQKVFFIGSHSNFAIDRYSVLQSRCVSLYYRMHELLSKKPDSIYMRKIRPGFQSYATSYQPVKTIYEKADPTLRGDSKSLLRRLVRFPIPNGISRQAKSFILLSYLLDSALNDDNCLERFHDRIFSETFRHGKTVVPSTFQCFTHDMAEELNGYDESFSGWGGEDNDFVTRASYLGYRYIFSQLLSLHLDHETNWRKRKLHSMSNTKIINSRSIINQPGWGLNCVSEEIC